MKNLILILGLISLTFMLIPVEANAQLAVDPYGITFYIDAEDSSGMQFDIINSYDDDIDFKIKRKTIRRDGHAAARRDDRGDEIDEKSFNTNIQSNNYKSAAWDYERELLIVSAYSGVNTIYAFDPEDGDEISSIGNITNAMDVAYLEGVIYCPYLGQQTIHRVAWDEDGELENIGTTDSNGTPYGIAADSENNWLMYRNSSASYNIQIYEVTEDHELGDEVGTIAAGEISQYTNGQNTPNLEWVPAHRDIGQLWTHYQSTMYQIKVDEEEWETVDIDDEYDSFQVHSTQIYEGAAHDGEDLWVMSYANGVAQAYDDGIGESFLVGFIPKEGTVDENSALAIDVSINSAEVEDGYYEFDVRIDNAVNELVHTLFVSVNSPVVNLAGSITDAADDAGIEGAKINIDEYMMTRWADAEGAYAINDMPFGSYSVTVSAPNFHDSTSVVEFEEEGDFDLSIALLHADFMASVEGLAVELEVDSSTQRQFTVTNEGNAPLTYSISKRLSGEANFEPWDQRENRNYADVTGDPRLTPLEYVNGLWYVGGGNLDTNQIFVLNEAGELVDQFDQIGTARRGMPDITWDGEHFWGSGDETIYQFNADGSHDDVSFGGPYRSCKGITWDPDRELLWICATTEDIVGYDRNGNHDEANTLDRMDFRITSLEYWKDDPDGYKLYINHIIEDASFIHKMNIETNDTLLVKSWTVEEGELGGFVITSDYDPYNIVLASMLNLAEGDALQVWQYRARDSWFSIEPAMGVINPAVEDTFTVTFDSEELPEDIFAGEFVFSHDAVGSENIITAELTVTWPEVINDPPSEFSLVSPADGDTIYPHLVNEIEFSWTASIDPDEMDVVIYDVWFMSGDVSMNLLQSDTTMIVNMYDVLDSLGIDAEFVEPVMVSWYVDAMSGEDVVMSNETFEFTVWPPDYAGDVEEGLPLSFELQSLYPNPFNSTTTLKYAVDHDRAVTVAMFDMNGREIYSRVLGNQAPGNHTHTIVADHLASGLYIVRLTSGADVKLSKVALMR
ncbi:carboxypeptidase regulatory-like domain-containing protein [Calditrichota bacterium]